MTNTLITVTGTWNNSHSQNWIECESTWIPKLREKGFNVLILMSNPYLDKEYEIIGNFFFCKCPDNVEKIYLKNHYYISKYFSQQQIYNYRFHVDNDTFIHPERFLNFIEKYTKSSPKDYVGCVTPYPGFNTNEYKSEEINTSGFYASGGSGFLLSKKSHKYLVEDFKEKNYEHLGFCDKIVGEILYKNKINLWHDSGLLLESPYKKVILDPNNLGSPFIGDKNSFLFSQHYCNGHMKEIMDKLDL